MSARSRYAGLLLASLLLTGCGDDGVDTPVPSSLAVSGLAAMSSEDGEPFPINDGAFVFNDTSDFTEPRRINR